MLRRNAITIIGDGDSVPEMFSQERKRIVNSIIRFKSKGGIVICVGVRAAGAGLAWLRSIASPGCFINVFGGKAEVANALRDLKCMVGHICGRSNVTAACAGGPDLQTTDTDPLPRIEPELVIKTETGSIIKIGPAAAPAMPKVPAVASNSIDYPGPPILNPPFIAAIIVDSEGRQWQFWGGVWH